MNEQAELWQGQFGVDYTERNKVDWIERALFWERMAMVTGAKSALEIGCNAGHNLIALRNYSVEDLRGVELNTVAADAARSRGLKVTVGDAHFVLQHCLTGSFDLVFTCGLLIHLAPGVAEEVMSEIIRVAGSHVLAVEYWAPQETEIEYRGNPRALWKRDYGQMYRDLAPRAATKLVTQSTGMLGKAEGFDDCTYWLLRKAA